VANSLRIERTAPAPRFVSYLRVSTTRQGASGLGLEAQRDAVSDHIRKAGPNAVLLREYVEVESGRKSERPQLQAALRHAKNTGAVLIIAKLDRLARNVHFVSGLMESGVEFTAVDFPQANRLTVHILAAVAEHEAAMISTRTKAALAAKKEALAREREKLQARGQEPLRVLEDGTVRPLRLGNPNGAQCLKGLGNGKAIEAVKTKATARAEELREVLADIDPTGTMSARGLARMLNERGFRSPRGGAWTAQSVIRLRDRLGTHPHKNT